MRYAAEDNSFRQRHAACFCALVHLFDIMSTEVDLLRLFLHVTGVPTLGFAQVYIVGGIVDRNRIRGGTASKAKELGLQTARLELSQETLRFTSGTTILTVNHVVEILLEAANGANWRDAVTKVRKRRSAEYCFPAWVAYISAALL